MCFVICDIDKNEFAVLKDDRDEVVIVNCGEVGDGDDEMLGKDMMNVVGEVMVNGADVIWYEYCDVEYFGCIDVIDCSVVGVSVEIRVNFERDKANEYPLSPGQQMAETITLSVIHQLLPQRNHVDSSTLCGGVYWILVVGAAVPSICAEVMPKFISEVDVEARKKIQEAEGIVEAPYDARSLYERLQAEKDRKQEEYEATNALKNRVHRLDEDEVEYLQTLAAKQYKADLEKEKEVAELVKEATVQANRSAHIPSTNITIDPNSRPFYNKGGSSQRALLANAVKRNSGSLDLIGPQPKRSNAKALSSEVDSEDHESFAKTKVDDQINFKSLNGSTRPVGVLPGLSEYSTSDSDQSTDSDGDESTDVEDAVCTLQQIACTRMRHTKTDGVADND
ncbi:hypothetical protein MN116_001142 [Schistosoma mekongi]|uniref:FAM192A/Fyv6 N-terminal domain-containing protein n=1 Tax=Schistosoma mekongi TaxID=38744 RepID=A0AAE1ZM84_SCHME|nr:hypothetical protein MN116_001142 [Schistosoma mekongi]